MLQLSESLVCNILSSLLSFDSFTEQIHVTEWINHLWILYFYIHIIDVLKTLIILKLKSNSFITRNFNIDLLIIHFQIKFDEERRSLPKNWFNPYFTVVLFYKLICYHQTKSDSINVFVLRVIYETKQFKKFFLVLLTNSVTSILYFNLEDSIGFGCYDHDWTLICKFDGVWLEI